MQRDRDDRDPRDPRDRERFPQPPDRSTVRQSPSFLHGLPPPISAAPRGYFPPSPSVASPGGLTDPSSWSSHQSPSIPQSDLRPSPSRRGWTPPLPSASPRFPDRLPPLLSDYGPAYPVSGRHSWEHPPPPPLPYIKTEPQSSSFRPPTRQEYDAGPREESSSSGQPQSDAPTDAPTISVSTPRQHLGNASRPQTAPSSSHSSVSKHGAPAGSETTEPPKKKKRRQAFSCAECAKRKQKCNRETPCQHCVSRKVPHLCIPSARQGSPPARPKPKVEGESTPKNPETATASPAAGGLSGRVSKLEKMMNAVLDRVENVDSSALTEWRQAHPLASSPRLRPTLDTRPNSGSSLTSAATATGTRNNSDQGEEAWVGGLDSNTRQRNPLPQSEAQVPLGLDFHGTPFERLERVVADGGEVTLREAFQYLPPKETADKLVSFFFDKVNPLRYPIDERLFRQAYEAVYQSRGEVVSAAVLPLPLIFAALAIAMRLIPDEWAGTEEQRRVPSLALFWQAFSGMPISTAINVENIQLVEARILLGLYLILMNERRLAEGWVQFRAAISLGQALCLHRDGTRLGLDPYMVEYRRRLWSYLCHADATYSCLLGRPMTIDPRFYDTKPPSNIDINELVGVTLPPAPKPLDEPTFATYLILRQQLADIVSGITVAFQNLSTPITYADVQAIDTKLQALRTGLPPQFRMLTPDKTRDHELPYLPVHRYYIQTEILHYTIILHRPWFLRQVKRDKYALSRNACFEAAITDFNIRESFHKDNPEFFETLLGGSFREFNTAMIAGINLLLSPDSTYTTDMWKIVTNYLDHHPHDPNASDEFSKKESAIINTLYRRAKAQQERQSCPSHPLQDKTSFERGSTRSDTPHASPKTPNDTIQDLFNQFLSANSELIPWPNALTGMPLDEGSQGLGVTGLSRSDMGVAPGIAIPVSHYGAQFAGDHSLAFGAVPCSDVAAVYGGSQGGSGTKDVNTSRYWDAFADVLVEQAGQA